MAQKPDVSVRLRLWSEGDLPLLEKIMGDPKMTEHLGGPETAEQLANRHERYVKSTVAGQDCMFVILVDDKPAGSIGYWEKEWRGQTVYETGWSVLLEFQGRGIATQATLALLTILRSDAKHRYVHAYPKVSNAASNAICKKAGFTLLEAMDFEYPKGNPIRCNDWRYDLQAGD